MAVIVLSMSVSRTLSLHHTSPETLPKFWRDFNNRRRKRIWTDASSNVVLSLRSWSRQTAFWASRLKPTQTIGQVFSKTLGTTVLGCLWHSVVRIRIIIACVRASHLCLRRSRVPFSKTSRRIQWSDGAGLRLFEVNRSQFSTNYTFPLHATSFPPKWSAHPFASFSTPNIQECYMPSLHHTHTYIYFSISHDSMNPGPRELKFCLLT